MVQPSCYNEFIILNYLLLSKCENGITLLVDFSKNIEKRKGKGRIVYTHVYRTILMGADADDYATMTQHSNTYV